jgi:hypothetical protein
MYTIVLLISHTYPIDIPYLYRYGISMGYIWDIYGTSPCLTLRKPLIGGRHPQCCPGNAGNSMYADSLLSGENVKISMWGHIQERG